MVQDLKGQVAEVLTGAAGALEVFAGVGFEEFEGELLAVSFEEGFFGFRGRVGEGGGRGHGGEVGDERAEVVVVGVGFEAEAVHEGDGEGVDEVQGGDFGEQVGFADVRVVGRVPLFGVDPDVPGQVARGLDELGPVLAAFDVAFVGARGAE